MATYTPGDVLSDLLTLRKGAGFTSERFANAASLLEALGGSNEPADLLHERFESAIHSLHDTDEALLLGVFALAAETAGLSTLTARRDVLGQALGLRREAVADRDAAAIGRLTEQLISGWYPKSPIPVQIPESHNGIVNHWVSMHTVVKDGYLSEARYQYQFFACFDLIDRVIVNAPDRTPIDVKGDFTVTSTPIRGGLKHEFIAREPMRRLHTYELAYRVQGHAGADPEGFLTEQSSAFHEPTRIATFETTFIGKRPTWVWWFTGLTHLERPGDPYYQSMLAIPKSGHVGRRFRNLYGGLYSGIAWEW